MHEQVQQKNINVGNVERWISGIGGAMLVIGGLRRRSLAGLLMSVGGAVLAYRGFTGRCSVYRRLGINSAAPEVSRQIEVTRSVAIERPAHEVYRFWRTLENVPRFMKHIDVVTPTDERRSHWVAREGAFRMEWDAEIVEDAEGRCIAWRSLPGGDVYTEGRVEFESAPIEGTSEVRVNLCYAPPGGIVGRVLSPILRRVTGRQVEQELEQLKRMMESSEARAESSEARAETARAEIGGSARVSPMDVGQVAATPSTLTAEIPQPPVTESRGR